MSIAAGNGWASTGLVGAGLAVCGMALFAVSWALERRSSWEPLTIAAESGGV
jgi:DHA1 family inner membrane transport protein